MKDKSEDDGSVSVIIAMEVLITTALQTVGLMLMWGWFVAPVIHATGLSFWQSLGIILLMNLLKLTSSNEEDTDDVAAAGFIKIYVLAFFILSGWLVSLAV